MQDYIIHKVHVKANVPDKKTAYRVKDTIVPYVREMILQMIEEYLQQYTEKIPGKSFMYVPKLKLKINAGTSLSSLEGSFKYHLEDQVYNQLDEYFLPLKKSKESVQPGEVESQWYKKAKAEHFAVIENRTSKIFFHFLETGKVPWYAVSSEKEEDFLVLNFKNWEKNHFDEFIRDFLKISHKEEVRKRLMKQFAPEFVLNLLQASFYTLKHKNVANKLSDRLLYLINEISNRESLVYVLFRLLDEVKSKKNADSTTIELLKKIGVEPSQKKNQWNAPAVQLQKERIRLLEELTAHDFSKIMQSANNSDKEQGIEKDWEDEQIIKTKTKEQQQDSSELIHKKEGIEELKGEIMINAGLVLVHPFLKHFFTKLELLREDGMLKNPELCAHLLHYIATGKEQDWEYNLLFEKILCGITFNDSIRKDIVLPDEMKAEVELLLKSVLENWPVLKNSSVELLRNEFLQREGKITCSEGKIHVEIQKKTQDILLNKLQWSLSMIRLPWSKQMIYTKWE